MRSSTRRLRIGRPVWLEGRTPRQQFATLRGRHDTEVAIVGAGATGSAVAALFAEAGVPVIVVDAALAGCGSTAASSALLLQEPDHELVAMTMRYGARRADRIWRLSAQAVRDFVHTLRRFRIACDLTSHDSVYCATTSDGAAALHREYRRRRRGGFVETWLSPGELRRLTGISGYGAVRRSGNAQIDPYKAATGLLRVAEIHGARIHERTRVRRIVTRRHGVRLLTERGAIDARTVIIATGYATREFRPLAGHFRLDRTYVLATRPMTERQRQEIGLANVMVWDTERPYHYARWTPDGRLLLGGGDRPVSRSRRRISAFGAATRDLYAHFEAQWPALSDVEIALAWEGLFAQTFDSLPFIGPHRRYPRHLFALGYGGNGMTFGFLAARQLLERWLGKRTPDHELFAFGRGR